MMEICLGPDEVLVSRRGLTRSDVYMERVDAITLHLHCGIGNGILGW